MNAGTRKASARIHASGLAKQAAEKPNIGTNTSPMSERAIISATPANIAKPEKPIKDIDRNPDVNKAIAVYLNASGT